MYEPYHMEISAWLKGKLSEFKKKTSIYFQLIMVTIKAAQIGSWVGTQWRWTYWQKEGSGWKHHTTHTNIKGNLRDFTVWKTQRMKHGSQSEVMNRVEKMPIPYLKANKRKSHPEMTLDKKKKTNKKPHLFLLLFSCFKCFYLCVQARGQQTMCVGQFYTSTVRVNTHISFTATACTHWDI